MQHGTTRTRSQHAALALAALGVVYGDIGTSPLYTIKEVFSGVHPIPLNPANVMGILSLILWSLIIIVSIKYVVFIMRADNRGEGGVMAMIALALHSARGDRKKEKVIMLAGLVGAGMFYGDGMITPAISVLSALEGLEVATPLLKPYVLPATLVGLFLLFFFQKRGTGSVGAMFGPIMILWFSTLAVLGISNIVTNPSVLGAVNPLHGLRFLFDFLQVQLQALGVA